MVTVFRGSSEGRGLVRSVQKRREERKRKTGGKRRKNIKKALEM